MRIFWGASIVAFVLWMIITVWAALQDAGRYLTIDLPAAPVQNSAPVRYTPDGHIVTDIGGYERDMEDGTIRPYGSIWE